MLINNKEITNIAKKFTVVIKSNTKATIELKEHCKKNNIQLLDASYNLGFGANNNYVFSYLKNTKKIKDSDYFLVINPDVTIKKEQLENLLNHALELDAEIFTVNLFRDLEWTIPESSIKRFPTLLGPVKGLLQSKRRNDAYDKKNIIKPTVIDWAAGSFLLFKKTAYETLKGFDDKFFMYFEDVDICRRAKINQMKIIYLPEIKATHKGAFNNRNIFSRHFLWYLKSYLIYHTGI
ncbi:glycosyltransferase family protein [Photobacterium leiognathi]|nr:glycosyltransferase [Photobacterium leiognathi]